MTLQADITTQRQLGPVDKSHGLIQLPLLPSCEDFIRVFGNVVQGLHQPVLMPDYRSIKCKEAHLTTWCYSLWLSSIILHLLWNSRAPYAGLEVQQCLSHVILQHIELLWPLPWASLWMAWSCTGPYATACTTKAHGCTSTGTVSSTTATVSSFAATGRSTTATACTLTIGAH